MVGRRAPEALTIGRRALEGISGYRLLDDLAWCAELARWFLRCSLTIRGAGNGAIPGTTNWCVLVADSYPGGSIKIFPAADGGITETFPHQRYNGAPVRNRPWRRGEICVTTPTRVLGRLALSDEPDTAEERLSWHIQRALVWLECASADELRLPGDPYEIPDFPFDGDDHFVFAEDSSTLNTLTDSGHRAGVAELARYRRPSRDTLVVTRFLSTQRHEIRRVPWGSVVPSAGPGEAETALWVLLQSEPVIWPWQAPVTFAELRRALAPRSASFDDLVLPLCSQIRDGRPHLLLLGFPIPDVADGPPVQLHWQAMRVPPLTRRLLAGFRANEIGWREADRRNTFAPNNEVEWVASDNWSEANAHARGRFTERLVAKKILLIGAGALGSAVAEMLVRGGVRNMVICDGDTFEHGNLSRHTLTMRNEHAPKAVALAARLTGASAHVRVDALTAEFPSLTAEQQARIADCDLILDCTAERDVLSQIEAYRWAEDAYVVSMAFGLHLHRLYIIGAPAQDFTGSAVTGLLDPLVQEDWANHETEDLLREGPGCWHPVFPGRVDDSWMMAAAGVKELERLVEQRPDGVQGRDVQMDGKRGLRRSVQAGLDSMSPLYWDDAASYRVELDEDALAFMLSACEVAGQVETGGILVGTYSDDGTSARISRALGPPEGSEATSTSFVRSETGLDELLKQFWTVRQHYLGEWHSHPKGAGSLLLKTDDR